MFNLSREDLQAIAQLVADQNRANERTGANNHERAKIGGGNKARISQKPTFIAIAKSLAAIVSFAVSGGAVIYLLSQLAPYI